MNLSNIYSCWEKYTADQSQYHWASYAEYLELELGEGQIEDEPKLYTYHYLHPYRYPSAVFRKVKMIETNSKVQRILHSLLNMEVKNNNGDVIGHIDFADMAISNYQLITRPHIIHDTLIGFIYTQ
jgi:hypothetical protein